jgi:hypothetical protein
MKDIDNGEGPCKNEVKTIRPKKKKKKKKGHLRLTKLTAARG